MNISPLAITFETDCTSVSRIKKKRKKKKNAISYCEKHPLNLAHCIKQCAVYTASKQLRNGCKHPPPPALRAGSVSTEVEDGANGGGGREVRPIHRTLLPNRLISMQ